MEQSNTPSTKGKGLGMAGMIIGIVALLWSAIPLLGIGAMWLAVPGLILSVIAFFIAKGGGNPSKGMMLTGIILNFVALCLVAFWLYKVAHGIGADVDKMNDALKALDTMKIDTS